MLVDSRIFRSRVKAAGFDLEVRPSVLVLTKRVHGKESYVNAEFDANSLFYDVPCTRDRNVWGSTSDGIGGAIAIQTGNFRMCISGVKKTFTKALLKG
jgi:hypothetical protein